MTNTSKIYDPYGYIDLRDLVREIFDIAGGFDACLAEKRPDGQVYGWVREDRRLILKNLESLLSRGDEVNYQRLIKHYGEGFIQELATEERARKKTEDSKRETKKWHDIVMQSARARQREIETDESKARKTRELILRTTNTQQNPHAKEPPPIRPVLIEEEKGAQISIEFAVGWFHDFGLSRYAHELYAALCGEAPKPAKTTAGRNKLIQKRMNDLSSQKVGNFLEILTKEFGLSRTSIKSILKGASQKISQPPPPAPGSLADQLLRYRKR
jgi:hypothetical protein